MASGPSLTRADCALLEAPHARGALKVIAVNDGWRLAPYADLLYAADHEWWDHHQGAPGFAGERWIPLPPDRRDRYVASAARWGLRPVELELGDELSETPSRIRHGYNGGFQAMNLAVLSGAARLLLLGYDCQSSGGKAHFFGEHPRACYKAPIYSWYLEAFAKAAAQLRRLGVEAVNCSRETALTCFPRATIEEALV